MQEMILMKKIDYEANSTLWVLPWKTGMAGQPAKLVNIPLYEAIRAMLNLAPDERERANIEVSGEPNRIQVDEAREISQRHDFPGS
jgi:hypothetical protein